MSHPRIFRTFLISDAVLTTASILTSVLASADAGGSGSSESLVHVAIEISVLVVWIVGLAGLWQFRNWARVVYMAVAVIGLLASLLLGSDERSGPEAALNALCWLVTGAIVALAYWSPLAARFRRGGGAV